MSTRRLSHAELEAATGGRDRFIDLVRALSILVVVFGHWTMAAISPHPVNEIGLGNVLEVSVELRPVTWLGQVMPLFFFAAGFTNGLALRRGGRPVRTFLAGRVERVTRPALLFATIWLALGWALVRLGVPEPLVRLAGQNSAMVLWFLTVYLVLAMLAPAQMRLHRRRPWLLLVVLPPAVAVLDQTQGTGWAGLGFLTYVLVFAFCQQLGLLYADGRLPRMPRWVWPTSAALSLGVLVALTTLGPYPASMIDLPGQQMSNMLPPSVSVVAVATLQVSLAMMLRPLLTRALARPCLWLPVVVVNRSIMTIFLWHVSAFVALVGLALAWDLPWPEPGTATWWWQKLIWLLAATLVTVVLVRALSFAERAAPRSAQRPGRFAVVGAVASAAGMTMLASAGFTGPFERGGVSLAGLTFAPAPGWALIALGFVLCWWPASGAESPTRMQPGR